jgi:uncharacterized protein with NAD-binding domain and iron-sulfur cluster
LQGYEVTLLEAGAQPGGLVAGWKTASGRSVEVGIHGFWYPYQNIFSLVDELGLEPFTTWTRSAQYSPNGLETGGVAHIPGLATVAKSSWYFCLYTVQAATTSGSVDSPPSH